MTYTTVDVPVRGGVLRAGVWGDDGPLVVAVHGITAHHQSWALVGPDLGRDHRFVAVDLRGRGHSRDLPGPYGIAGHAADLAAVSAHLGDPVVLVGHSMGGMVVAAAARLGMGEAVVLVDGGPLLAPPPGVDADTDPAEVAAVVAAVVGPSFARLTRTFTGLDEYLEFWRAHPSFREWNAAMAGYAAYDLVPDGTAFRASCRLAAAERDGLDLYNRTGRPEEPLPVPATFLRATRGMLDQPDQPFYPAGYAETWLPGITVRDVAGANHYTITLGGAGAAAVADAVRAHTVRTTS